MNFEDQLLEKDKIIRNLLEEISILKAKISGMKEWEIPVCPDCHLPYSSGLDRTCSCDD